MKNLILILSLLLSFFAHSQIKVLALPDIKLKIYADSSIASVRDTVRTVALGASKVKIVRKPNTDSVFSVTVTGADTAWTEYRFLSPSKLLPSSFTVLSSPYSSTSTTPGAVTGWSFPVVTGKSYKIEVIGDYQTAALTTGATLALTLTNGAGGTVRGEISGHITQSAAASPLRITVRAISGAGSSLTTTGVSVINSPHYIGLLAMFTCNASGTLNIAWASEVAASAAQLNAGSTLFITQLN